MKTLQIWLSALVSLLSFSSAYIARFIDSKENITNVTFSSFSNFSTSNISSSTLPVQVSLVSPTTHSVVNTFTHSVFSTFTHSVVSTFTNPVVSTSTHSVVSTSTHPVVSTLTKHSTPEPGTNFLTGTTTVLQPSVSLISVSPTTETRTSISSFVLTTQTQQPVNQTISLTTTSFANATANSTLVSGLAKREASGAMFLSPKIIQISKRTIEIALEKVYTKYPQLRGKVNMDDVSVEEVAMSIHGIGLT